MSLEKGPLPHSRQAVPGSYSCPVHLHSQAEVSKLRPLLAISNWLPDFVNKVFSDHSQTHQLLYCLGCFHATVTELYSYDRDRVVHKAPKYLPSGPLPIKNLPAAFPSTHLSLLTRLLPASVSLVGSTPPGTKQESSKCLRSERPYVQINEGVSLLYSLSLSGVRTPCEA